MGRRQKINLSLVNPHRARYITRCPYYRNGICGMRTRVNAKTNAFVGKEVECDGVCDRMRIYDDKNERYKKNQEKKRAKELKEKQENYNNNEEIRCK
jgi:hypothetical protein